MNWVLFAGSIAGVLALATAAWLMGLGGGGIADADEAKRMAREGLDGFDPLEAFVSGDGKAALVTGRDGSIALLKAHGVHIAARRLSPPLSASPAENGLRIASGERMFGDVVLILSSTDRDKLLTKV